MGANDEVVLGERLVALGAAFAEQADVVELAVCLAGAHKARARLVHVHAALGALEARDVPGEVGRYLQQVLVGYRRSATETHREQLFFFYIFVCF